MISWERAEEAMVWVAIMVFGSTGGEEIIGDFLPRPELRSAHLIFSFPL